MCSFHRRWSWHNHEPHPFARLFLFLRFTFLGLIFNQKSLILQKKSSRYWSGCLVLIFAIFSILFQALDVQLLQTTRNTTCCCSTRWTRFIRISTAKEKISFSIHERLTGTPLDCMWIRLLELKKKKKSCNQTKLVCVSFHSFNCF